MKKTTFLFVTCLMSIQLFAQGKFKLNNTETSFYSYAPLEDIKALNKTTSGVIDTETNKFSFKVKIKDFVFPSSLMQEHFNENYMESEKFPHSTFKGNIKGDYNLLKDGNYPVVAIGELNIHGVNKQVEIPSIIQVSNNKATFSSEFKIALKDYNIEIPTMVFQKIAEIIDVKISGELVKLEAK
jgi:polyisoprenoid-binding protein YceI